MIKIDKGVPPPNRKKRGAAPIFPWTDMRPGDSFFAAGYRRRFKKGATTPQISLNSGRRIHPGSAWQVEEVTEDGIAGVRVWRLS